MGHAQTQVLRAKIGRGVFSDDVINEAVPQNGNSPHAGFDPAVGETFAMKSKPLINLKSAAEKDCL